jgi:hypothetical protein
MSVFVCEKCGKQFEKEHPGMCICGCKDFKEVGE